MKIFTEQQRFNQWWLYTIIGIVFIAMTVPIFLNSEGLFNDKAGKIGVVISFLSIILVVILLRIITLYTRIDEKGIHYQFFPFHRSYKVIIWNDISRVYVRKYKAISEYGGWGFRGSLLSLRGNLMGNRGVAYSVNGNKGIQIELVNGKKILIGTQKEVNAEKVIENYNQYI